MGTSPFADAPIFGRSDVLTSAVDHLDRCVDAGGPGVCAVVGVPGIGKSRLVAEVLRRTTLSPVRRLIGFEPERALPFAGVAPLLRMLSADDSDRGRRLAALLAAAPGKQREGVASLRLFEAVTSTLLATTPALLVIDDLQWLDDMSCALVHHVLRAALTDGAPLALLCASRPSPQAHGWLASIGTLFAADGTFTEFELEPLDLDSGIALAQSRNRSLSRDSASAIWASANGSPFWISLHAAGGVTAPEPRRVLTSLLRTLSDDGARSLAAIVVFARPTSLDDLAQVLGWATDRAEAAVGELVRRGIATTHGDVVATMHDLVRETAEADVPADERIRLHAAISDVVQATARGDLPKLMEAIEHACAADIDATGLVMRVLSSPQRRLIGVDGLERLAAIIDNSSVDVDRRTLLIQDLATLAEELGSFQTAVARLEWLSVTLPDRQRRAETALRAAQQAFQLSDSKGVRNLLNRARTEAADDPWMLVAVNAVEFNRLVWLEHDAKTAASHRQLATEQARTLAAAAGGVEALDRRERAAYVQALDAERVGRLMDDDMDGLLQITEELVSATRGMGERHLDDRTLPSMALRFFNRWQDSADGLATVIAEAEQQIYPQVAAYATYELSLATYHLGDVALAREQYDKAARLGARVDGLRQETMDTWLCGLGHLIDASLVDWRSAVDGLVAEAAAQTNAHCRLALHQRAAMLAARFDPADRCDFVETEVAAGNADAVVAECVRCRTEIEIVTAELLARIGETQRAHALIEEWRASHPAPKPRLQFFLDRAVAMVAARCGDPGGPALLAALADSAEVQGLGLERVWALLDLADAVAGADREQAIAALTTAATTAANIGAASERGLADRRLRALGARPLPAPRSAAEPTPLALSRREVEVARLAARGARNAEIAASLFLSQKTVEQHLTRVFTKLGVRNRAELGARFAEQLS